MQGTSHKWRNIIGQSQVWNDRQIQYQGKHPNGRAAFGPSQGGDTNTRAAFRPEGEGSQAAHASHMAPLMDIERTPPDTDRAPPREDVEEERAKAKANVYGTMRLSEIKCPICDRLQPVGGAKLRTSTGFSMIKCKATTCREVVQSNWWKCRCGVQ